MDEATKIRICSLISYQLLAFLIYISSLFFKQKNLIIGFHNQSKANEEKLLAYSYKKVWGFSSPKHWEKVFKLLLGVWMNIMSQHLSYLFPFLLIRNY